MKVASNHSLLRERDSLSVLARQQDNGNAVTSSTLGITSKRQKRRKPSREKLESTLEISVSTSVISVLEKTPPKGERKGREGGGRRRKGKGRETYRKVDWRGLWQISTIGWQSFRSRRSESSSRKILEVTKINSDLLTAFSTLLSQNRHSLCTYWLFSLKSLHAACHLESLCSTIPMASL